MNCHPLASPASAATAPSSSPGGGTVYDNNNTIPTEYGMHHQAADISGGEFDFDRWQAKNVQEYE